MSLEHSLVLGRYRVLWRADSKKLITAYFGRDELSEGVDVPVVVKEFRHQLGDGNSPATSALFEELASLEQLRQPGVVALLGHEVVRGSLVTVQARSPGTSLVRLCESFRRSGQPFPAHLAVFIVRRLLRTLHQCHSRPERAFMHGRITLGCIHLPRRGDPEISDFGLAKLEDAAAEVESRLAFFHTRMSYAAPEVPRGGPLTAQGDVYSLALVLYRLLSGSNPLRGRSLAETLQRVLRTAPGPLHRPDWEHCEQGNEILMRALSKEPGQRYQSCEALFDALAAVQTGTDESLAEELASLISSNDADWTHIDLLPHSLQPPSRAREAECSPAVQRLVSGSPAFVSGLATEQPKSGSEHRRPDRARRPRWTLAVLAGIGAPAVLLLCALALAAWSGARSHVAARAAFASGKVEQGSVGTLRARLRGCRELADRSVQGAKIELAFGSLGRLSSVHLSPSGIENSRLGACLLARAWDGEVIVPGATSIIIALDEP